MLKRVDPKFSPLTGIMTREDKINKFINIRNQIKEIDVIDSILYEGYEDDFLLLRSLVIMELYLSFKITNKEDMYIPPIGSTILSDCLDTLIFYRNNPIDDLSIMNTLDEIELEWFNLSLKYFSSSRSSYKIYYKLLSLEEKVRDFIITMDVYSFS